MSVPGLANPIPLPARRVLRVALATALALAIAYVMNRPLPYMVPLFTFMICAAPGPALQAKSFVGLLLLVLVTCGAGLLLTPVLGEYPAVGLALIALGLYLANYIVANKGQNMAATLLTVGLTMITAAGTASFELALAVVGALLLAIVVAVVCQHIVHAIFPDDGISPEPPVVEPPNSDELNWRALRATLIVFPPYLVALINPMMYMPLILKSAAIGQQDSVANARMLGRETVVSTFLAGCLAILFWLGLKVNPSLWMFFLWMLLFGLYISAKLYGVSKTRYPPSFWLNVGVTLLILVGPAVADSANGNDVYVAFAVRFALFVGVALYAWAAMSLLDFLRRRAGGQTRIMVVEN
ncbi:MAG: hypothetical protein ACI9NT_000268 [Bacteroidia bacterium]|jgi:hypothetical protein